MTETPKEQAEAMAREIVGTTCFGVPEMGIGMAAAKGELIVGRISAALEKLIAERDAWKDRAEKMKLGNEILSKERDTLQSQLTATTLNAEKKEYEPPNPEPIHWECAKCGCFNRLHTHTSCVECGTPKL